LMSRMRKKADEETQQLALLAYKQQANKPAAPSTPTSAPSTASKGSRGQFPECPKCKRKHNPERKTFHPTCGFCHNGGNDKCWKLHSELIPAHLGWIREHLEKAKGGEAQPQQPPQQ